MTFLYMHLSINSASTTPNGDIFTPKVLWSVHLLSLFSLLLKHQILSLLGISMYSGKHFCTLFCGNHCCLQLPKKLHDCVSAVSSSLIPFAACKNSQEWILLLSHWPELSHLFFASTTTLPLLSPSLKISYVFFLTVRQLIYSNSSSKFVFVFMKFIAQMGPGLLCGSSVIQNED